MYLFLITLCWKHQRTDWVLNKLVFWPKTKLGEFVYKMKNIYLLDSSPWKYSPPHTMHTRQCFFQPPAPLEVTGAMVNIFFDAAFVFSISVEFSQNSLFSKNQWKICAFFFESTEIWCISSTEHNCYEISVILRWISLLRFSLCRKFLIYFW